jgi:hypothetical protein
VAGEVESMVEYCELKCNDIMLDYIMVAKSIAG